MNHCVTLWIGVRVSQTGVFFIRGWFETPFNPADVRSTTIFPRSLHFTLSYGTFMLTFRMNSSRPARSSPARPVLLLPSLRAPCALRVKPSMSLFFTLSTLRQKHSRNLHSLTPFLSIKLPRSSSRFFTLKEISPSSSINSEKHTGYPLLLSRFVSQCSNLAARSLITSPLHCRSFGFGIAPVTSRPRCVRSVALWRSFCLPPSVAAAPPRCHTLFLRALRVFGRDRNNRISRTHWGQHGFA